MSINEIVRNAGFDYEEHVVTTDDGFELLLQRIYKPENYGKQMPAALMMHGLFSSADHWVANGPDKSPAFKLANEGMDVWLGNNRGNNYSRRNENIDPDTQKA